MSRRRVLSPEEAALWARVTAGIRPRLPPPPAQRPEALPSEPPAAPAPESAPPPPFRIGARALPEPATRIDLAPLPGTAPPSALQLPRRTLARLARGGAAPEGRIDLHGMTLAEARPALGRFIAASHLRGLRLVLVITGKGRAGTGGGEGPIPERPGLLRREVPRWLAEPPLAALVVQVTEAHARHGGAGALYVRLRRPG